MVQQMASLMFYRYLTKRCTYISLLSVNYIGHGLLRLNMAAMRINYLERAPSCGLS